MIQVSDVYKELYAVFVAPDPEASFTAAQIDRSVRATLKAITNNYIDKHAA